jgi:hypothetical protein
MTSVANCELQGRSPIALTIAPSPHQAYLADMVEIGGGGLLRYLLLLVGSATLLTVHPLQGLGSIIALTCAYFVVGLLADWIYKEFGAWISAGLAARNDVYGCDWLVPFGGPAGASAGGEGYTGPSRIIR